MPQPQPRNAGAPWTRITGSAALHSAPLDPLWLERRGAGGYNLTRCLTPGPPGPPGPPSSPGALARPAH
jgi:hypothetical protein